MEPFSHVYVVALGSSNERKKPCLQCTFVRKVVCLNSAKKTGAVGLLYGKIGRVIKSLDVNTSFRVFAVLEILSFIVFSAILVCAFIAI